eukprot:CAMPEP_0172459248 /NCGR_PEP_ID=MMETSP1065-20121228/31720_1 /TAXON_ID=265537 /ORGANISM="Amphiprora paludosa, Strain CCMP125" /LENGTH=604 /DNA_ID=CAMNT_0013213863 /DNA_START=175 /DNA_END=1989 /DNA_ORIENTATION=-
MVRLHNEHQQKIGEPPASGIVGSVGGSVGSATSGDSSGKRRRRRRRTKKPASGRPMPRPGQIPRPGPRPGGSGSRPSPRRPVSSASGAKRHDAPMEKRDLYFSLRCGMVATGPEGNDAAVGRVTLVNWDNQIVLDTFVKVPPENVFDYRTELTGITAELLAMTSALRFDTARTKVGNLIRGKILIGHGLEVDLTAMGLSHPWSDVRDTATYAPFMKKVNDPLSVMLLPRGLDELMVHVFNHGLNPDQPSLVREAVGCLDLYKLARSDWENELVHVMQQKEKQRQLVLNMRATGGPNGQLSSINEDSTSLVNTLTESGHHVAYEDEEDYTYTSSTIASTDPSLAHSSLYYDDQEEDGEDYDDVSEASSFFTQDASVGSESSFFRLRQLGSEPVPSHIENITELENLGRGSGTVEHPYSATGSGTAPGSRWTRDSVVSGELSSTNASLSAAGSGIWSPLLAVGEQTSVASSADWSRGTPTGDLNANALTPASNMFAGQQLLPNHVPLTEEEELQEHLPSHLLDDMDQDQAIEGIVNQASNLTISSPPSEGRQKLGWFGGRKSRTRSASGGSSKAESVDDGRPLSSSERSSRSKSSSFNEVQAPPGF